MTAKIRFDCGNGCSVEIDASNPKDAVAQMSAYLEVFGEQACGQCGAAVLFWEHRQDRESHDYYAVKCRGCGAELSFGQTKVGDRLFAKRKLEDGSYDTEHHGWKHWKARSSSESPSF